jgi:hypothetical protein
MDDGIHDDAAATDAADVLLLFCAKKKPTGTPSAPTKATRPGGQSYAETVADQGRALIGLGDVQLV